MTDQMQGLCCCLFLSISSLLLKIPTSLALMRTILSVKSLFFSSDSRSVLSPVTSNAKSEPRWLGVPEWKDLGPWLSPFGFSGVFV